MRRFLSIIFAMALAVALACARTAAVSPVAIPGPVNDPRFTDTTAAAALRAYIQSNPASDEAAIHGRWIQYLETSEFQRPLGCGFSDYWVQEEQGWWETAEGERAPLCYDIASSLLFGLTNGEVIAIEPSLYGVPGEYRVETRFSAPASAQAAAGVMTRGILTVYAVRAVDGWRFASAIARNTRSWPREVVGQITFVIQPGHRFRPDRARRTVTFADSLADAFGLPRLRPLTYYVTTSGDAMMRLFGAEPNVTWGSGDSSTGAPRWPSCVRRARRYSARPGQRSPRSGRHGRNAGDDEPRGLPQAPRLFPGRSCSRLRGRS